MIQYDQKADQDIEAKQKTLNDQIEQIKAADKARRDTGGKAPNVKAPTAAAQTAVNAALSKLGKPHVWGATGPDSFDCSGLMLWAYNKAAAESVRRGYPANGLTSRPDRATPPGPARRSSRRRDQPRA